MRLSPVLYNTWYLSIARTMFVEQAELRDASLVLVLLVFTADSSQLLVWKAQTVFTAAVCQCDKL